MNFDDISVLKDVENEILSEMKNKKVKIIGNNKDEFGEIVGINMRYNENKIAYILSYNIKYDEKKEKLNQVNNHMTFGKNFIPINNLPVKIVVNKSILDTKEFDRDMRVCSILGYDNNDKKIQVLKTQDVYAVALIKQSKKLYPNSLDFVFVTKKDNLKDVTTVIALPASFIENIEDVEKSLFQMPDDEEITKKFNKYREIQIEKYKELQLAEAKRKENNTNLNLN